MCFQRKFPESRQPSDYEKDIDALASDGYIVIINVGPLMADATALKAKQYPSSNLPSSTTPMPPPRARHLAMTPSKIAIPMAV
jgi:hypothetical protein